MSELKPFLGLNLLACGTEYKALTIGKESNNAAQTFLIF